MDPEDIVSDHAFGIKMHSGRHMGITASHGVDSVCMFINDCVDIHHGYTTEDLVKIQRHEQELPLLPGRAYNAEAHWDGSKVFVVTVRDISKDEEIFFAYGR